MVEGIEAKIKVYDLERNLVTVVITSPYSEQRRETMPEHPDLAMTEPWNIPDNLIEIVS